MASPQKENGHLRMATELVLVFCIYRLSGQEWQVLWVILRKTWGWNKKKDRISLSQISELTSMNRPGVVRILNKLIKRGVLKKENSAGINAYTFNKNYEEWQGMTKAAMEVLSKMIPPKNVDKSVDNSPGVINLVAGVIKNDTRAKHAGVIKNDTYNKQYKQYTIGNQKLDLNKRWPNAPKDFKELIKKLSNK